MKEKQRQCLEAGTGHPGALQVGCLWEQTWSSCRLDRAPSGPQGGTVQPLRRPALSRNFGQREGDRPVN